MLHTRACEVLGIEVPILCAPMGPDITSPELAAAVSNAGGLGILSWGLLPPPMLRDLIARMRELTDKPFGVNLILQFPVEESVEVCIQERVPVLSFYWGDPSPYVARAHAVYKQKVVEATETGTVRTTLFGGLWPHAPHRALRTPFVEQWLPEEARGNEQRPDEPIIGQTTLAGAQMPVPRFMSVPPSASVSGDIESMALLAGQGVGLVRELEPAAEVVREMIEGAREIITRRFAGLMAGASKKDAG
ncbi:NAD(P)H-dependent flavin oxidoreductase [Polyangium aurulentum]|uniref:NAD(P)H-dependent flavin oxidoreductase n=1 Tax=Polyangium aurulentum TaxID=2567896 RepID=UPI0010ADE37E|nr:nitronate monooxygenase [Polyangium aurulentum]UQA59367.1 nitronate monooxygenase [Polyangium aurulentum]